MRTCGPRTALRLSIVGFLIGLTVLPAPARAAEPLLMFLLGFAQNLMSSAIEARNKQPRSDPVIVPVPVQPAKPPASMDEADLRALIDDSFGYLSRTQRAELMAGLDKALSDPATKAYRETIITQFVNVARQIQFTHGQLARLSTEDKQAVANRFATNFRTLSPEQQQALLGQLRLNALPLPSDLNDMMLTALSTDR